MSWLWLRPKLVAAGLFVMTAIAFVVRLKFVTDQRDKLQVEVKKERARADQAEEINDVEQQLDEHFSELEEESESDVDDGKIPDHIRDRNKF